jgi:hypothetical protein
MKDIMKKELAHVQQRQALKPGVKVEGAEAYLDELKAGLLDDFAKLFLASAFINRQRGE